MDELLDRAPCGYLSFTDDGTIALVNATLLELLGYRLDELQGQHIETILPIGARLFYQTHFFPLLKLHGKAEEIYFSLRCKSGETLPVLTNAVRNERDGHYRNNCIFIAIHQRNQYEDEILQAKKAAEQASQAKAKFLSMMSHELRTPLNVITGFTDILALELSGPNTETQREDLGRIKNASQHLLRLINDILNFARLEAGQVDVVLETVTVDEAMARAVSLITSRLREAGLEYHSETCGPSITVRADPDRLQQILLNLLTNAIKFTERGGRITLTCEPADNQVHVHVRDTGCGIAAEQIDFIFDPFVQVDRLQVDSSQRGVGLGLAISRDLARVMGGDLTAKSTLGEGSTFTLTLPAADPA